MTNLLPSSVRLFAALVLSVVFLSGCKLTVLNHGGGTVTGTYQSGGSSGPALNCGVNCYVEYGGNSGTEVLTATPDPGYTFAGWAGDCTGTASCILNVDPDQSFFVEAFFSFTGLDFTAISDQVLERNFAAFNLQASATATQGGLGPISYSLQNRRPDVFDVGINSSTGLITVSSITDKFGDAAITVEACVASGCTQVQFQVAIPMPQNPVFACGTGVETETADSLPGSYTLFEPGQVRPIALSPNEELLFVANTPANCLEIYDVTTNTPNLISSVSVGLSPVAVAAKSDTEIWVVNHLSDSISIVDIAVTPRVTRTLLVGDEPRDIVFAGPGFSRAFITAAYRGQNHPTFQRSDLTTPSLGRADVWVFDSDNVGTSLGGDPLTIVNLFADTPRALTVAPNGSTVYAAAFMSGNQTTVLDEFTVQNNKPAPNSNVQSLIAPDTGLIVKQGSDGIWRDEDDADWSDSVRFSLPDQDIFVIDALAPVPAVTDSYTGVGTTLFNMVFSNWGSTSGRLIVTNTEAQNQVRFEGEGSSASTVRGDIAKNRLTIVEDGVVTPEELNSHIDFTLPFGSFVSAADKEKSIAQPGAIVAGNGSKLYLAGFGSGKIYVLNQQHFNDPAVALRTTEIDIPGGGPAGLAHQPGRSRLFVYSRFDHQLHVLNTWTNTLIQSKSLFTPEPAAVIAGRPFLYDAQLTSSNGTASCASCHVFADLDHLSWDLGDPDGFITSNPNQPMPGQEFIFANASFHPMKGPMVTQTFRGIADSGPLHWRGDRTGQNPVGGESLEEAAFKEFNGAFVGLLGNQTELATADLQALTDFAMALTPPPNPIRNLDNSLTSSQQAGRDTYMTVDNITGLGSCNACHALSPSQKHFGTNGLSTTEGGRVSQLFKIPHLRNAYTKVGMFGAKSQEFDSGFMGDQIRGFGFLHDGSVDTLTHFFGDSVFNFPSPQAQTTAEVIDFVLAFDSNLQPIVGQQVTLSGDSAAAAGTRLSLLRDRSLQGDCDLIGWGADAGGNSLGARLLGSGDWALNTGGSISDSSVRSFATQPDQSMTFTCVPPGEGERLSRTF